MRALRWLAIVLMLTLLGAPAAQAQFCGGSKPVHVRSYVKKDGTLVRAHCRSLPKRGIGSPSLRITTPRAYAPRYTRSKNPSPRLR